MENILLTKFSAADIKNLVLEGIREFYAEQKTQSTGDRIGGIELAEEITGLKPPTIYAKCSNLEMPHFKQGGKLRFSSEDLINWVKQGKRKTHDELTAEATAHTTTRPIRKRSIITR